MGDYGLHFLYLFLLSIFTTSGVDLEERVYYFLDNAWLVSLLLLTYIIISSISVRWGTSFQRIFVSDKFKWRLMAILGVLALIWITCTQFQPTADQLSVYNIAQQIKMHEFGEFELGGYIVKCPHQKGLLLIFHIYQLIFSSDNLIAFQLLNVVALITICYQIYEIVLLLYKRKDIAAKSLLAVVLFFPMALYITFFYGTLIGLAFTFLGIKQQIMYLESREWKSGIKTIIYIVLATIAKQNYQIVMIAVILLFIADYIIKKQRKSVVFILMMVAAYIICHGAINAYFEYYTGIERLDGIPAPAYMAMGLQEGWRGNGWYNGYVSTLYDENYGNKIQMTSEAIQKLKELTAEFITHPKYAVTFLTKKVASEWCEPTFQSFWIGLRCSSAIQSPSWVASVLKGKTNLILTAYLNVFQSFVYAGVLLYLWLQRQKIELKQLLLGIIFIGGFLFHLIWEAKGQYTITYFCTVLPYAVIGYQCLAERICKSIGKVGLKRYAWKGAGFIMGFVLLLTAVTIVDSRKGRIFRLNYDDDKYVQFLDLRGSWDEK